MIENQSDNIENKENGISDQDNVLEDSQLLEDPITDNGESSSQKTEDINTEDLKNTISNNDARLEQLENCLLYTSPSPRDPKISRMPSSA